MTPALVPPHDDVAEQAVLGSLLLDVRLAERAIGLIRETDFYRPAHRRILAAVTALAAEGLPTDLLAVRERLSRSGELAAAGGDEYLTRLLDATVTSANVDSAIRVVREYGDRRALLDLTRSVAEATCTSAHDAAALRRDLLTALLAMATGSEDRGFCGADVPAVLDAIERRGTGRGSGLLIGVPEFDEQTQGLDPGELVVLGAAPKVGKSTVAGLWALHVAITGQGGVGYVSCEMSNHAITERWLSALAGVPIAAMRAGTLVDAHYRRLAAASGRLHQAPLWIDDSAVPRLDDVISRTLALKAKHPTLALVVVDFLQLVRYPLKGRRGDEELTAIAYALKDLAKRAKVAILAPAQLNQKAIEDRADNRPLLRDLSGSSGPLQAADFVVLLHRRSLYEELPPGHGDNMLCLVEAARRTPTFDFFLQWQAVVMRGVPAGRWIRPDEPLPLGSGA